MLDIKFDRIVLINGRSLITVPDSTVVEDNILDRIITKSIPEIYRGDIEVLEGGLFFTCDEALIVFAVINLEQATTKYDDLNEEVVANVSTMVTELPNITSDNIRLFIEPNSKRLVYEFI